MVRMKQLLPGLIAAALSLGTLVNAGAEQRSGLRVVELFTSQGCPSCPRADDLLSDLTQVEGLLPLAFHVDYWNYLGWSDALATPEARKRHTTYLSGFDRPYAFTPHFVVDGTQDFTLTTLSDLDAALSRARSDALSLQWQGTQLHVRSGTHHPAQGVVLALAYDQATPTDITAGENAGRSHVYRNAVRSVQQLAAFTGEALTLNLEAPQAQTGLAILVVSEDGNDLGRRRLAHALNIR